MYQTPGLFFDLDQIDRNIDALLDIAGDPHRLWPHIKTHKSSDLVMYLQARGIRSFKCATISEARLLGTCGVTDALLAYPATGAGIEKLVSLAVRFRATRFSCLVEDIPRLKMIEDEAWRKRTRIGVLIDIDTGQGRTGITGSRVDELVGRSRDSKHLDFRGFHVYDGQNHQSDLAERSSAVASCLEQTDEFLKRVGVSTDEIVIAGGTPTFPLFARRSDLALSPGTAVVYDAGYRKAFPDLPFEPAAWVASSVVSVHGDTITLDAGTKAIATDPSGARGEFPGLEVTESLIHNEEHWVLRRSPDATPKSPGDVVRIIPSHICPTVNLYNVIYLAGEAGMPVRRWKVDARDRIID